MEKAKKPAIIDKKKPNKLDKIRAFLLGEVTEIPKTSLEQYKKYQKVIALAEQKYSKAQIIKIIQSIGFFAEKEAYSEVSAYNIYNEAMKLLGDTIKIDKQIERYFSYQRYLKLSKKAEDAGDFETAGKLQEKADRIYGLFEQDAKSDIPPSLFFQQVTVIRSSAKEVLMENLKRHHKQIEIEPEPDDYELD